MIFFPVATIGRRLGVAGGLSSPIGGGHASRRMALAQALFWLHLVARG
jgi:hypothetical protein